jgi:disulfide bond formation protein DsbB
MKRTAVRHRLPRSLPLFVILVGVAALSAAFFAQYVGGLAPCPLCLWQRYPYGVAIVLGLVALILTERPAPGRAVLALAGLAFLASAGIAIFHVGVERHWWAGLASCSGAIDLTLPADQLAKQLMDAPVVRCDRVAWSLFGLSIAGYNVLYAGAAGLITLWAASRRWDR